MSSLPIWIKTLAMLFPKKNRQNNEEVVKEEEGCTYAINPIQPGKEEMSSDKGRALLKEITGYDFFKMHVGTNVTFQEIKWVVKMGI